MFMGHSVRHYQPTDWPTVKAWWEAHQTSRLFEPALLPPVGVIAECDGDPHAACWLYMAVGVGVAFVDMPVSKPGLKLSEVSAAFRMVLEALEAIAKAHDYGVIIAHTLPPIARHLQRQHGFEHTGARLQCVKLLQRTLEPAKHGT